MPRTDENYLRWQFARFAKLDDAPNIALLQPQDAQAAQLIQDEHPVAAISCTSGGSPLIVTDVRLLSAGQTIVKHKDVQYCEWIAPSVELIDLDNEAAREMKRSHYDRLILEMRDGQIVTLEGLGQAVFPLLKFYLFKLGREPRP